MTFDRQIACNHCHQRSLMSNSYCIYCGVVFPKIDPNEDKEWLEDKIYTDADIATPKVAGAKADAIFLDEVKEIPF